MNSRKMRLHDRYIRPRAFSFLVVTVLLLRGIGEAEAGGSLVLADGGESDFAIVVSDSASASTHYAAQELSRFIEEISGARLPVVPDTEDIVDREILLGDNEHLRKLGVEIDFDHLGDEGYAIQTTDSHLVIAGGELRGNLYGVYGLLEDHFGCRWFTPEVSRIPKQARIEIGPLDETIVPALEYREPYVIDCFDGDWCARNRVNSSAASLGEKHGGKVRFGKGLFVHTFETLVPTEEFHDTHPEYFALIGGERRKALPQLCCTNEDVIRLCTERLRQHMREDPSAFVFSLSQNDGTYSGCQCENCEAVDRREESQIGQILYLVNRVAEALEDEFPDKAIETLAYSWSTKPPKTLKPHPNVIIRLCSIKCCFTHPIAECDSSASRSFVENLRKWSEIADRLWVWDYTTNFNHFLAPFPNLRVRDDNIRLFIENNVKGVFEQDNYLSLNGELSGLSGYLGAKFLWNPDYDEDQAIDEFLAGVYGKAAPSIREYIDLIHDKVERENIHGHIGDEVLGCPYLTPDLMAEADRLWQQAEESVTADREALERVRAARLCVDYTLLEQERGEDGLDRYTVDHERFQTLADPEYAARARRFFEVARRADVTWVNERRDTLDKYEIDFQNLLKGDTKVLSPLDPVPVGNLSPGLRWEYFEGIWQKLPDFKTLDPIKAGTAETVGLGVQDRDIEFGLRFSGFIEIPRDGVYTFFTKSNDGSRLSIGSKLVVESDGLHKSETQGGFVALRAGVHPLEVTYFQEGGGLDLSMSYEGPGIEKQEIPAAVLFHRPAE